MKNTAKAKRVFLNFFADLAVERTLDSSNNYGNWFSTYQHIKKVVPKNLTFEEIDEYFIKKVRRYFEKDAISKSDLPLSQNSKYSYFNKFKAALRNAFDNGYLTINNASKINPIEEAFHKAQLIQFFLETKIFPVSEKADSIIKKMTEKHFSHFKILAEKAKYSHIKFLYTSIFALTIDIVSQIAKSADSSNDSRAGLEELLRYVETTFLVQ